MDLPRAAVAFCDHNLGPAFLVDDVVKRRDAGGANAKRVTVMNNTTEMTKCNDTVTVDHWIGEFVVTKIDSVTGNLHLVGCGLSGWVPPSHAHRTSPLLGSQREEVRPGTA